MAWYDAQLRAGTRLTVCLNYLLCPAIKGDSAADYELKQVFEFDPKFQTGSCATCASCDGTEYAWRYTSSPPTPQYVSMPFCSTVQKGELCLS